MTPPLGYNLLLMKATLKCVSMNDLYASILPVVSLLLLSPILVMVFSDIAMYLTRAFK